MHVYLCRPRVHLARGAMIDLPEPSLANSDLPLPPKHLRLRVAGNDDADRFAKSGRMSVQDLDRALASIGRSFSEFADVLEWGCGCGRILRHLRPAQASEKLYGVDIDQEAVSWINENLPRVSASRIDGMPPLPYTADSFDLIFNHSVMSHLNEVYQDAWLAELARVLRPGGIITLTVKGRHAFKHYVQTAGMIASARITDRAAEDTLRSNGIIYIDEDQWSRVFPNFYHTAFHDVGYVFDRWTRFFDLRSYIPRGALDHQDMVVLQKPTNQRVQQDLPELLPCRDKADLERVVSELQREKVIHVARLARMQEDLTFVQDKLREVHTSLSWRLTRPIRALRRLIAQGRNLISKMTPALGRHDPG